MLQITQLVDLHLVGGVCGLEDELLGAFYITDAHGVLSFFRASRK